MTGPPIAGKALLSDRHSAALASRDGSTGWLCLPRSDSPPVFAALFDDDAGHWPIRPAGAFTASRKYAGAAMMPQARSETPACVAVLADALAYDARQIPSARMLEGAGPAIERLPTAAL